MKKHQLLTVLGLSRFICIVVQQSHSHTGLCTSYTERKRGREGKRSSSDPGRGTAAESDDLGLIPGTHTVKEEDLTSTCGPCEHTRAHTHTHTTNRGGGAKGRWVSIKRTGSREPARFSPGVPGVQGGLWGQSDLGDPARKGSHKPSIRGIYS